MTFSFGKGGPDGGALAFLGDLGSRRSTIFSQSRRINRVFLIIVAISNYKEFDTASPATCIVCILEFFLFYFILFLFPPFSFLSLLFFFVPIALSSTQSIM